MATVKRYRFGKLMLDIEYPPSRKPEPLSESSAQVVDDFIRGLNPTGAARVAELEITADGIKLYRRRRSRLVEDKLIVPLVLDSNNPTEAMLVAVLNQEYLRRDLRYLVDLAAGNERIDRESLVGVIGAALWMEWAVKTE